MILAIDVHYDKLIGVSAGIAFNQWGDAKPSAQFLTTTRDIEEYIPGQFYKRELPCLLNLLNEHALKPSTIIIDGYVYLDTMKKPGLGKYLSDAIGEKTSIIGVAKKAFHTIHADHAIIRGNSKKPLYITAIGDTLCTAKQRILSMHGEHRIPTLLKAADQLCRSQI